MVEKKFPLDIKLTDDVEKTIETKKIELIKSLIEKPSEDPTTEIVRMSILKELMQDFKNKTDNIDEKILSKALTFSLVQQALQANRPQQDLTPFLLMLSNKKNDNDEFLKFMQLYLQQQQQMYLQQQQMQQQLFSMLFNKQENEFNKSINELSKKLENAIAEINFRIDMLKSQKAEKEPKLRQYIQELIETKTALEELREHLGLFEKETPVVDDKGKIQAGKLIERGLKLVEKILEKMPLRAPEPKPVQEIQPQFPIEPPKEEETTEDEKLKEIENKIEELEKKAELVHFNIPEPEINKETQSNIEEEEQNIEHGGVENNEVEEVSSKSAGEQESDVEVAETGIEESESGRYSESDKEQ